MSNQTTETAAGAAPESGPERSAPNGGADEGLNPPAEAPARRRRRRGSRGGRKRSAAASQGAITVGTATPSGLRAPAAQRPEAAATSQVAEPDGAPVAEEAATRPTPDDAATIVTTTGVGTDVVATATGSGSSERSARPRIGDTRPAPTAARPPATPPSSPPEPVTMELATTVTAPPPGSGAPVEIADDTDLDDETQVPAQRRRRRGSRERQRRAVGRYVMVVHVRAEATQVAILEGRTLVRHHVASKADSDTQIDGNIYLGRVQNVLPGMEAAFIDIGTPKNAVLYQGDLRSARVSAEMEDAEEVAGGRKRDARSGRATPRIEQVLRPRQMILTQVTKNPIGAKGARLTQEVSLPGRFVVLVPGSDTYGISKRLDDDERRRLRQILDRVRPPGHGLIVRTAAEGASEEELQHDVSMLVGMWGKVDALAQRTTEPALLYKEPNMSLRMIREEFNRDFRAIYIDDRELWEKVYNYVGSISPDLLSRVQYYDSAIENLPPFERFHVHEQLHKALDRKVWLSSGGSIVIDRAEALTVIDVNTGKHVGTSNLEETVFKTNLEAAEEIARQLQLRDIGGIIVIDFIDMEVRANRDAVMRTFREALSRDKTRTQAFDMSELCLVEMTRKRVSEGLVESLSHPCPECSGRGILLDETLL